MSAGSPLLDCPLINGDGDGGAKASPLDLSVITPPATPPPPGGAVVAVVVVVATPRALLRGQRQRRRRLPGGGDKLTGARFLKSSLQWEA